MALSEIDRNLLERCLERKPRAWEDFVDRFMGLVVHVVGHTAQAGSFRISAADRDDLTADVFLNIVKDDFAVLRHFRGQSSLATYLTVVARRIVVKALLRRKDTSQLTDAATQYVADFRGVHEEHVVQRDEVERLLSELEGIEATVVRMYHLEEKSYQEIGQAVGVAENSVGPILSRARGKLRRLNVNQAAG